MESQKHFKRKVLLIVKEQFIGLENANSGKVTNICKELIFCGSLNTNMGF